MTTILETLTATLPSTTYTIDRCMCVTASLGLFAVLG